MVVSAHSSLCYGDQASHRSFHSACGVSASRMVWLIDPPPACHLCFMVLPPWQSSRQCRGEHQWHEHPTWFLAVLGLGCSRHARSPDAYLAWPWVSMADRLQFRYRQHSCCRCGSAIESVLVVGSYHGPWQASLVGVFGRHKRRIQDRTNASKPVLALDLWFPLGHLLLLACALDLSSGLHAERGKLHGVVCYMAFVCKITTSRGPDVWERHLLPHCSFPCRLGHGSCMHTSVSRATMARGGSHVASGRVWYHLWRAPALVTPLL
mmetsp:Transcript_54719/g.108889  ORF Transcript_54719/g.108889 Transcript_54719/m.108889 type:complete len:265 (+) Transcript_54719:279-1073(+)